VSGGCGVSRNVIQIGDTDDPILRSGNVIPITFPMTIVTRSMISYSRFLLGYKLCASGVGEVCMLQVEGGRILDVVGRLAETILPAVSIDHTLV
jgi:hypothetical protein